MSTEMVIYNKYTLYPIEKCPKIPYSFQYDLSTLTMYDQDTAWSSIALLVKC